MKNLVLILGLVWEFAIQAGANDAVLKGIIDFPPQTVALIQAPRGGRLDEFALGEGQKDGMLEMLRIDSQQRKVHVRIGGNDRWLSLDADPGTNNTPSKLVLRDAPFSSVLYLFSKLTGCSMIQHPHLKRDTEFTLNAPIMTERQAREALAKLFAAKNIAIIPDGKKFILVVPSTERSNVVPEASKQSKIMPEDAARTSTAAADDSIPLGMLDFRAAPPAQALALYADLVGRQIPDRENLRLPDEKLYFLNRTALSKHEAEYAIHKLLQWAGVEVTSSPDGKLKVDVR